MHPENMTKVFNKITKHRNRCIDNCHISKISTFLFPVGPAKALSLRYIYIYI